jgi:hypothetical protein
VIPEPFSIAEVPLNVPFAAHTQRGSMCAAGASDVRALRLRA